MLLDAASGDSKPKKDMLQVWLQGYINTLSERKRDATQKTNSREHANNDSGSMKSINSLAFLFYFALNDGHTVNEWNQHSKILCEILDERTTQIKELIGSEPASRRTLQSLYASYELTTTVTKVMAFISKQPNYKKVQKELSSSVADAAKHLLEAVLAKSAKIKAALGESGWMDKVLDSVRQNSNDAVKEEATCSESLVDTLSDVVGDGFMEDWAGSIVESWKDSVIGFSFFKPV